MPKSNLSVDETHIFMYHIFNGVNDKTINWDAVCKATNLNKGTANMRWFRLRGRIEDALKGNTDTESADNNNNDAKSGNGEAKTEAEAKKASGNTMPKMGLFKPRPSKNGNTDESEVAPPAKKRRTTKRKRGDQTDEEDADNGVSKTTAKK